MPKIWRSDEKYCYGLEKSYGATCHLFFYGLSLSFTPLNNWYRFHFCPSSHMARHHIFEVTGWPVLRRIKEKSNSMVENVCWKGFKRNSFGFWKSIAEPSQLPNTNSREEEEEIIDRGKERSVCLLIVILESKHDRRRSVQLTSRFRETYTAKRVIECRHRTAPLHSRCQK